MSTSRETVKDWQLPPPGVIASAENARAATNSQLVESAVAVTGDGVNASNRNPTAQGIVELVAIAGAEVARQATEEIKPGMADAAAVASGCAGMQANNVGNDSDEDDDDDNGSGISAQLAWERQRRPRHQQGLPRLQQQQNQQKHQRKQKRQRQQQLRLLVALRRTVIKPLHHRSVCVPLPVERDLGTIEVTRKLLLDLSHNACLLVHWRIETGFSS